MKNAPVLVQNPYTGKYVNVLPLFDLMNGADEMSGHGVAMEVDDVIRFLCLEVVELPNEVQVLKGDALYNLYRLKDAFEGMKSV